MPKYRIYAIATASWPLGEYEAETEEAAMDLCDQDRTVDYYKSLCHHCASEVELGDTYKTEAEEL